MELFIRIKDGQPFEHPIFGDNFREAFPDVDVDNLPPEFARFERVEQPYVGIYDVYEGVTYERDGDIIKDVHHIRAMTLEEKTAKQEATKDAWAANPGWTSWTFNDKTCSFDPPVERPNDGKAYKWNESTLSWDEIT